MEAALQAANDRADSMPRDINQLLERLHTVSISITDRWIKFLYIFFAVYNPIVFLYVRFGR